MSASQLQSLTSFKVTAKYGRSETALDVTVAGQAAPVARLFKASQYDSRQPFQLLVGPELTELDGLVNGFAAYAPDRTKLGAVQSKHRPLRGRRWQVDQPGLPTLTGRATGTSAVRYAFPFALVLSGTVANSFFPFNFAFRADGSQGFEVSRRTGVRARFTVTVHDPRVDRRLVLAAVVALNQFESSDLRQEAVDLTANPFNA